MRVEIRNPKSGIRRKSEERNSKEWPCQWLRPGVAERLEGGVSKHFRQRGNAAHSKRSATFETRGVFRGARPNRTTAVRGNSIESLSSNSQTTGDRAPRRFWL